MINLITRISVIGIAVITAALVVLLSAFNGIEKMIEQLYSEFDPDITVRSSVGKSFNQNRINLDELLVIDGIANISRAVEEIVILKHEDKWVNANMYGVDSSYLQITHMNQHMVDGLPVISEGGDSYGVIGATLLDKLDGFIPNFGHESIVCYVAKRDINIRPGKNPFRTEILKLSGRINYNKEVNARSLIVPLETAQRLTEAEGRISALYIDVISNQSNEQVKSLLKDKLGSDFEVKTNYEKNELIYKTSKSEKLIVLFILLFIFILAAFNLIASLTMLFVEKRENLHSMISFGASRRFLFKLFFYEGLLIAGKGILIGMTAGYLICIAQLNFNLLLMPNSGGEPFPISISFWGGVLIFTLVSLLSILFSAIPVSYLIRKNIKWA